MDIGELLAFAVNNGASDLHLSAGLPPLIRVDGDLIRMNASELSHQTVHEVVCNTMNEEQLAIYANRLETDFSFEIPDLARFRVNAFNHQRGCGAVFRTIPARALSLEELGAPDILRDITGTSRGVVLITGPTGSGKSTTLAAMIDHRNESDHGHILTIEDPIEFVHQSKKCLVSQREVHRHTLGFNDALRSALREDPDLILVGELRDLETIRLALTAAETGHLVLGTLHTSSAAKTIDRVVDVFPAAEKDVVRAMLAESLRAVIAQTLLKKNGGGTRRRPRDHDRNSRHPELDQGEQDRSDVLCDSDRTAVRDAHSRSGAVGAGSRWRGVPRCGPADRRARGIHLTRASGRVRRRRDRPIRVRSRELASW